MSQVTVTPAWTTGDRLRKARQYAGISSSDMAARLDVSRNTISNYEHDKTQPSLSALRVYSIETGVPMSWLLGEDDDHDVRSRCFSHDGITQLELFANGHHPALC